MRRGIGASRILNARREQEQWDTLSATVESETIDAYEKLAEDFKADLYVFIEKYKGLINKDPAFRLEFLELCDIIGVDPLSNSSRISRAVGLKSFYVEVAVRLLEVCLKSRAINGGICEMSQVISEFPDRLNITENDILRAIKQCSVFGKNSIRTLCVRGVTLIVTSPFCLSNDHRACLDYMAEKRSGVTVLELSEKLECTLSQAQNLLDQFIERQVAWIDQTDDETFYWFPCLFHPEHTTKR
ncbi:hypothetical protein BBOV_II005030 [Babesia bovis T2Bo]|uniref:Vacuolar-sorting protein SNF8 n=1 Tax=Babesia bovis TaxID=5865 RepID=A7AU46_BABBO|nr:hypothetical protein BBOV_II005030 [Babesia bovis T2Bo]EDO06457.1 hypothetical protein BBOV_II005030 [Babesia bovis T2Bo]|eukprot:XP_001610025.1 hypothetical protein [Babesia bovis T2Bo]